MNFKIKTCSQLIILYLFIYKSKFMETKNITHLEKDKGNVLSRLFCRKKFLPHRWLGLAYLI